MAPAATCAGAHFLYCLGALKRFRHIFLAGTLLLTVGAQWTVLQSVAWLGMMVAYSEKAPLNVALQETFDGQHPCCLCKVIAAARKSEKNSELTLQLKRLEFPPVHEQLALVDPSPFTRWPRATGAFAEILPRKPLLPPPRGNGV